MEIKLRKLYNTLLLVETKGDSTKIMGECLKFVEQLISEAHTTEIKAAEEKNEKAIV